MSNADSHQMTLEERMFSKVYFPAESSWALYLGQPRTLLSMLTKVFLKNIS